MKSPKCAGLLAAAMLLLLAAAAQAADPPKGAPKGPQGWGVFLHLQFAARGGGVSASLMDHPLVDGARYSLNWAELEPLRQQQIARCPVDPHRERVAQAVRALAEDIRGLQPSR